VQVVGDGRAGEREDDHDGEREERALQRWTPP
jgi:hypothetical protein